MIIFDQVDKKFMKKEIIYNVYITLVIRSRAPFLRVATEICAYPYPYFIITKGCHLLLIIA